VLVLHSAKFAYGQALARDLEFFLADGVFFAGLQAFGGIFVRDGNGAVAGYVLQCLLVELDFSCYGKRSCLRNEYKGYKGFFHKFSF
jgi:hypothetical protein